MKAQLRIIILFLILTAQVSAQDLRCVLDINLRKELDNQGFVTNDSLDLRLIHGRLQLELNDKGIENLDGLQYFVQVWRLVIDNNNITHLQNLPPNLTHLSCSNNKISNIAKLPQNLISLNIGNNLLKQIPSLPKTIQYINYCNNPIQSDNLIKPFQGTICDDPAQNCLPYELMNWKILNATIKDTLFNINGMTIKLNSEYSWGFGSQVEIVNFKIKKSKLVARKMQVNRFYNKDVQPNKRNSAYYKHIKYSVEVPKINHILKDIYLKEMVVQFQSGDSLELINLKKKKNGRTTCRLLCSDCTGYDLQYTFYSQTDTMNLNYKFTEGGPTICRANSTQDIKSILDWIYVYKLTNLSFYKHETTSYFFNKNILDKVRLWANNTTQ